MRTTTIDSFKKNGHEHDDDHDHDEGDHGEHEEGKPDVTVGLHSGASYKGTLRTVGDYVTVTSGKKITYLDPECIESLTGDTVPHAGPRRK